MLPLDVMSGSWGVVVSRTPKAEAGHACLQLQAAGRYSRWPNILPAIRMPPNSQLYDTSSLFLRLLANTVSGFATWPGHLLHVGPEWKYLALASYVSSLTLNFTVCKMGSKHFTTCCSSVFRIKRDCNHKTLAQPPVKRSGCSFSHW